MKTNEKKAEFIELRANGLSYAKIAEKLQISKSTCSTWEAELREQIQTRKEDRLTDLYNLYEMDKESRIKRVGKALREIDEALAEKDLKELPAETLLKYKLKYEEALRNEYSEPTSSPFADFSLEEFMEALADLYKKQESGLISPAQAKAQIATLANLLTAYKMKDANAYLGWDA